MITSERLDQITHIVERAGLNEQTISALRETFSDLHLTYCMDSDIGIGEPVRKTEHFNLYLVDGREHCLRLTTNAEVATGLVLAETDEDDDD